MSQLQKKRQQFRNNIRKQEKQIFFQQLRSQLLNEVEDQQGEQQQPFTNIQEKSLIKMLRQYNPKTSKPINFKLINEEICLKFSQNPYNKQFKWQLLRCVFQFNPQSRPGLASAGNLLIANQNDEQLKEIMNEFNLEKIIRKILQANLNQKQEFKCARQIVWVICSFFKYTTKFEIFCCVLPYFQTFISQIGYYSVFLNLLAESTKHECLLPSKQFFLQSVLQNQMNYQVLKPVEINKHWKIIDNFLRIYNDKDEMEGEIYEKYGEWMGKRLIEHNFPDYLKIEIINLFTAILKSMKNNQSSPHLQRIANMQVLRQILYRGQFIICKQAKKASVLCICALIDACTQTQIEKFTQNNPLIELLVNAFDLDLSVEEQVKVLIVVVKAIATNEKFMIIAHRAGITKIFNQNLSSSNERLCKIANFGMGLYQR